MLAGKLQLTALGVLAPLIIGTASFVRLPVIPVCNRTALYLLAQYKLAVGDSRSAVQLLNRAAEAARPNPVGAPACPATAIHERT